MSHLFRFTSLLLAVVLAFSIGLASWPVPPAQAGSFFDFLDQIETYSRDMNFAGADTTASATAYQESLKQKVACIPKDLGNAEKDTELRIARAIAELGNDQLERTFGGIQNATHLSEAELQFQQCKASQ